MRVTRRKSNYVILFLLLALAGVSGSGFVFLSQPARPPPDTFIMEVDGDPDSMDPHVTDDVYGARVFYNVYETLYTYPWGTADTEPSVPLLAASAPVISADGLQYNISLRQEVIFHDYTPFNASCVKWNIERAAKMFDVSGPAWMIIEPLKGGGTLKTEAFVNGTNSPEFAAAFDEWQANSSAVVVLDTFTVQFNLERPFTPFIATMTHSVGSMMSPTCVLTNSVNDTGPMDSHWGVHYGETSTFMGTHTCGTGPYMLDEWRPYEFLKLDLFEDYWRIYTVDTAIAPFVPAGLIESVYINVNEDVIGRLLNLRTGLVDYADWPSIHADEVWVNDSIGSRDTNLEVRTGGLSYSVTALIFNLNLNRINITRYGEERKVQSPFVYRELRKCFSYAFNYGEAIDSLLGGWGIQAKGFIPQGMFGQNSSYWLEHYDIDEAVDWWNQAMLLPGFVETMNNMSGYIDLYYDSGNEIRRQAALLVKDCFAAVLANPATNLTGIPVIPEIRVSALRLTDYIEALEDGELPFWLVDWAPDYADPHNYAYTFVHSQSRHMSASGYENGTVDEWIVNASMSSDQVQRMDLYNRIQEQVSFDQPSIYMYQPQQFTVHRAWLKGIGLVFNPMHDFYIFETFKDYEDDFYYAPSPTYFDPLFSLGMLLIAAVFISLLERAFSSRGGSCINLFMLLIVLFFLVPFLMNPVLIFQFFFNPASAVIFSILGILLVFEPDPERSIEQGATYYPWADYQIAPSGQKPLESDATMDMHDARYSSTIHEVADDDSRPTRDSQTTEMEFTEARWFEEEESDSPVAILIRTMAHGIAYSTLIYLVGFDMVFMFFWLFGPASALGFFIGIGLLFITMGWSNRALTNRLWRIESSDRWLSLFFHGVLLFCGFYIVYIVQMYVFAILGITYFLYPLAFSPVNIIVGAMLDGHLAKVIASIWRVT